MCIWYVCVLGVNVEGEDEMSDGCTAYIALTNSCTND